MNESEDAASECQIGIVNAGLREVGVACEVPSGYSRMKVVRCAMRSRAQDDRTSKLLKCEEMLAENILLKRELRSKLEEILSLQNQLEDVFESHPHAHNNSAVFRLKSSEEALESASGVEHERSRLSGSGDARLELSCLFPHDDPVFFGQGNEYDEPTANATISESVLEWAETNPSQVLEKVGTCLVAGKELCVGGVTGWLAALALKKFGTLAATALGGGLLLLQLANHRGYVVVNWSHIYTQLGQSAAHFEAEDEDQSDWLTKRFNKVKNWSKGNKNVVIGFVAGFLYKTYT